MDSKNKRYWKRHLENIFVIITKKLPNGKKQINQFSTANISEGGVFIDCEKLDVLDVGREYEGIIDIESKQYNVKYKAIRNSKLIDKNEIILESGYGLMFINPPLDMIMELKIYHQKRRAHKFV